MPITKDQKIKYLRLANVVVKFAYRCSMIYFFFWSGVVWLASELRMQPSAIIDTRATARLNPFALVLIFVLVWYAGEALFRLRVQLEAKAKARKVQKAPA